MITFYRSKISQLLPTYYHHQMTNLQKLQNLLAGLFQIDKAELDFWLYRIMNYKKAEVEEFINDTLPKVVQEEFDKYKQANSGDFQQQKEELKKSAEVVGMPLEELPKYKELKAKYDKDQERMNNVETTEREVYDYVFKFFQRYFSEGDFYAKRRYSQKDKYAIPYNGEETHFYWTNQDQYYIKTAENFSNYQWKAAEYTISFQLEQAETDTNNNKSQDKRYFILSQTDPIIQDSQVVFFFNYRSLTTEEQKQYSKQKIQDQINQETYQAIIDKISGLKVAFHLTQKSTETKDNLQKHISRYTAKNSEDYFIHKDIKGFLEREMDFYIKNEVFHIEDIGTESEKQFKESLDLLLGSVKVIKTVSNKIIDFVAQLENFQKKLYEKKKLVYGTNYCISVANIPQDLWKDITSNESQQAEWVELGMIAENTKIDTDFLSSQPTLPVDTRHFSLEWKYQVLWTIEDLDSKTNGVLINSENFQALKLLESKYQEKIKCVYIDPPYNTGGDWFIYKDWYQHSSWLSLMKDRLAQARELMTNDWVFFSSIDNNEFSNLDILMNQVFWDNKVWDMIVVRAEGGWLAKQIVKGHEYLLAFTKDIWEFPPLLRPKKLRGKVVIKDWKEYWVETDWFRKEFGKYGNCHYEEIEEVKWKDKLVEINEWLEKGLYVLVPTKEGKNLVWRYRLVEEDWTKFYSVLKYLSAEGVNALKDIMWNANFSFPKPVELIKQLVLWRTFFNKDKNETILDFFAGSGTTAQAVMNLNKEDKGNRKFLLVEMGEYFDSVLLKRTKKVMFSDNRKEWKATDNNWHRQIIKYHNLEQYEDTLNNLELTDKGSFLVWKNKEDYVLNYMLDLESKESLFNLKTFNKPFDYTINISQEGELKPAKVDLIETFNYLLGLTVKSVKRYDNGVICVKGQIEETTKTKQVLIVWRDLTQLTQADFTQFYTTELKGDYDMVYINGDTYNIAEAELIEAEFFRKMF